LYYEYSRTIFGQRIEGLISFMSGCYINFHVSTSIVNDAFLSYLRYEARYRIVSTQEDARLITHHSSHLVSKMESPTEEAEAIIPTETASSESTEDGEEAIIPMETASSGSTEDDEANIPPETAKWKRRVDISRKAAMRTEPWYLTSPLPPTSPPPRRTARKRHPIIKSYASAPTLQDEDTPARASKKPRLEKSHRTTRSKTNGDDDDACVDPDDDRKMPATSRAAGQARSWSGINKTSAARQRILMPVMTTAIATPTATTTTQRTDTFLPDTSPVSPRHQRAGTPAAVESSEQSAHSPNLLLLPQQDECSITEDVPFDEDPMPMQGVVHEVNETTTVQEDVQAADVPVVQESCPTASANDARVGRNNTNDDDAVQAVSPADGPIQERCPTVNANDARVESDDNDDDDVQAVSTVEVYVQECPSTVNVNVNVNDAMFAAKDTVTVQTRSVKAVAVAVTLDGDNGELKFQRARVPPDSNNATNSATGVAGCLAGEKARDHTGSREAPIIIPDDQETNVEDVLIVTAAAAAAASSEGTEDEEQVVLQNVHNWILKNASGIPSCKVRGYARALVDEGFDTEELLLNDLTLKDLQDLDILTGHRKCLWRAIEAAQSLMKEKAPTSAAAAASTSITSAGTADGIDCNATSTARETQVSRRVLKSDSSTHSASSSTEELPPTPLPPTPPPTSPLPPTSPQLRKTARKRHPIIKSYVPAPTPQDEDEDTRARKKPRLEEPLPTTMYEAARETASPDVSEGRSPAALDDIDEDDDEDDDEDYEDYAVATTVTRRTWTSEEDAELTSAVTNTSKKKYGKEYKTDWPAVAALVPGRKRKQCSNRWNNVLKPNIDKANGRRGKWAADEDKKLKGAVQMHGGKNWGAISALVPGRSEKQCCSRWKRVLGRSSKQE
jgi:hypothetical protein